MGFKFIPHTLTPSTKASPSPLPFLMQASCLQVLIKLQPLCHKTTLLSPNGTCDSDNVICRTSVEDAAFVPPAPLKVNPESRLSRTKSSSLHKSSSPAQETNTICPTRDSMVWPFVLETQLSKQSGEGKALLTTGKRSHAKRLPNENFSPSDDPDLGLEPQSHPPGSPRIRHLGGERRKEGTTGAWPDAFRVRCPE